MHGLFKDIAGQTFERLTVLWPEGRNKQGTVWLCACKCGNLVHVVGQSLRCGRTLSCGCYNREVHIAAFTTHGGTGTPEYDAYRQARQRCNNPKCKAYPEWGGRGIQFKFQSFEEFFAELGPRPGRGYSVDRKNNNGHYEPGNVRWATAKQQANNQRKRRKRTCPL